MASEELVALAHQMSGCAGGWSGPIRGMVHDEPDTSHPLALKGLP